MQSILKEFAYGNISPEVRTFKRNSEYGRAMKVFTDAEEKLFAVLNEEEKALFNEYIHLQLEVLSLSCVDKFVYGYRLGMLMAVDVFMGEDDLVVGGEG